MGQGVAELDGRAVNAEGALASLRATGLAMLPPIRQVLVQMTNAYLLAQPVHRDAHIPQTARNRGEPEPIPRHRAVDSGCVCLPLADAIIAPHLFERALEATDIAAAYLGRDPPVAYSANVFWTRRAKGVRPDIQEFHRDADDVRFLVMFVYLTDVVYDMDGPHQLTGPDGVTRAVYGRAGAVFLADTSHMHRGLMPQTGERGIAWFRWGVSDRPAANVWDGNEPIQAALIGDRYPTSPRLRESVRLLVAP